MADAKEVLEIAALVVPVGSLVFYLGMDHGRIKALERLQVDLVQRIKEFAEHCTSCKGGLDNEDSALHGRVTALDKQVSRIEGRMEGGRAA